MQLSKSDYMLYLKHPAWLWYKKYEKNKLPEVSEADQALFDAGNVFERYAEELFPKGMHLGFSSFDEYTSLVDRTARALHDGEKNIYQGRFEAEQLTFICDVLQVIDGKLVDLTEIKATTKVKPEHIYDLAFQVTVLEKCGYEVRNVFVAHVDNEYVRDGDIDPEKMTQISNVTEKVKAKEQETLENIVAALEVASSPHCPDPSPTHAKLGSFSEWLGIYKKHFSLERGSIFELGGLNAKQLGFFEEQGITKLLDIPNDFELKPKQILQLESTKLNKPIIHSEPIKQFLDQLEYPLYFLDYETMGAVVPFFDGHQPYKQYPFQYSLHILDSPDAELRHVEYLHTNKSNPIKPLSDKLKEHIGEAGSIITWNMSFEKSCNDMMGKLLPEYKEFYASLNSRILDLGIPFAKGWYTHKDFRTSWSIKNVMPVLIPDLSYKDLTIQDGTAAQRTWMHTVLDEQNQDQKDHIFEDLIKYCELDTLAMVEIWRFLRTA